jgi:hypothetical protein
MAEGAGEDCEGGGVRALATCILALAALPSAAPAQMAPVTQPVRAPGAPGTVASGARLVALTKTEVVLDRMFQQLVPLMVGNVVAGIERAPDAPADLKLRFADTTTRNQATAILGEEVLKSFRKRYPDVAAEAAKAYAATFSEADLQAAIAFYSTPAGQRFIDAQPWLQQTLGQAGQKVGMAAGAEAVPAAFARILALPAPGTK